MTRVLVFVAALILAASWLGARLVTWAETLLSAMR